MNTPNVRVPALSRLKNAGKEQLRTLQHYFDRRHSGGESCLSSSGRYRP